MKSGQHTGALATPAQAAGEDAAARPEPAGADTAAAPEPASADTAAGPEPAGENAAARPGRPAGRGWLLILAVLLALLVAGLVIAAVLLARVHAADAASSSRRAAVAAARHAVTDLTTADYRHPRQYAGRLQADATGRFLTLFTNSATGFASVLEKGRVQTTGHVAAVGVRQAGPDAAKLSVVAQVTVKNSQAPAGSQRTYRLSVSMIRAGSRWLVSDVEFVR